MRNLILAMLAFFLVVALPAQNTEKQLYLIDQQIEEGKYHESITVLDQLLRDDPNNPDLNFRMGQCLIMTYRAKEALVYLESALSVSPGVDPRVHYYLGIAKQGDYRFKEAITEFMMFTAEITSDSKEYKDAEKRIQQCLNAQKTIVFPMYKKVTVENMGLSINTEFSEHSPVVPSSDSIMYFTSRRPGNLGQKEKINWYDEDVYFATRIDSVEWAPASTMGKIFNSKGHDASVTISPDGKTMFIYRQRKKGELYETHLVNGKWTTLKRITKPINSKYYESTLCYNKDSSMLFFASSRPQGFGGRDLYYLKKENGKWSAPINMGPNVNTEYEEDAPWLHLEDNMLYFSSNSQRSIGGFDIFVTEFDSSAGSWKEPVNLGFPVNSPDDDIYFSLSRSDTKGYFTSSRNGGNGEKDIYCLTFPVLPWPDLYPTYLIGAITDSKNGNPVKSATITLIDATTGEKLDVSSVDNDSLLYFFPLNSAHAYQFEVSSAGYQPYSFSLTTEKPTGPIKLRRDVQLDPLAPELLTVVGTVKDVNSKKDIVAKVQLNDQKTGNILSTSGNNNDSLLYFFELESGQKYQLVASAKGYQTKVIVLTTESDVFNGRLRKDIELTPGDAFANVLQHIYFDFNSSMLRKECLRDLDSLVMILKKNPNYQVRIIGFTDWYGTYDYNLKLSGRRSMGVMDYLLKKGVKKQQILPLENRSETKPLQDNASDEGRQFNRRVEFEVIDGTTPVTRSIELRNPEEKPRVDYSKPKTAPGFDGPAQFENPAPKPNLVPQPKEEKSKFMPVPSPGK